MSEFDVALFMIRSRDKNLLLRGWLLANVTPSICWGREGKEGNYTAPGIRQTAYCSCFCCCRRSPHLGCITQGFCTRCWNVVSTLILQEETLTMLTSYCNVKNLHLELNVNYQPVCLCSWRVVCFLVGKAKLSLCISKPWRYGGGEWMHRPTFSRPQH
jgi:hypothetical protein